MGRNKSIARNSFYSVCYKMMNVLFPLIISIYSSHVLSPEGVGRVALAQNIVTYFVTIAALGIPNYGTKKIGSIQNDFIERNKIFTELFVINFVSTLICSIAFSLMYLLVPYFKNNILYLVFSSLLIFNIANVDWLYQGLEEYKYIAVRSIIVKLACLIALPIFVRNKNDVYQYAIILCMATVGNYIFNVAHLHRFVRFVKYGLDFKRHLKSIFMLLASVCATEIYTMLDSTMVGTICSETELGYYTNAMKSARMTYVLITAACAVYLPRLSLYYKENKANEFNALASQGMKLVLVLSVPIFVGVEIFADRIIPVLFGVDFTPGILTLRILAILVIIFSVAYIGGHVILIASNKEKYTMIAAVVGAISNFSMNLIFIRSLGFNGAAIASVIAESLVTSVLLISAKNSVRYLIEKRFVWTTLVSSIIMGGFVLVIKWLVNSNLISCILGVLTGATVYFILQILLKNDFVLSGYSKIIGRISENT